MKKDKLRRKRELAGPNLYKFKRGLCVFYLSISIISILTAGVFAEDRIAEGAKDIARGVASVPRKVAETSNESNILYGITVGMAEGLLDTARGIGEGVFKILTFYSQDNK